MKTCKKILYPTKKDGFSTLKMCGNAVYPDDVICDVHARMERAEARNAQRAAANTRAAEVQEPPKK